VKTIVFDFDGTLTRYPIPRYELLLRAGYPNEGEAFLANAERMCRETGLDRYQILYKMVFDSVEKLGLPADDNSFCLGAEEVCFHPGAVSCLEELSTLARLYVLTCGYAGYIRHTAAAPYLTAVCGTEFVFRGGEAREARILDDSKKGGKLDEIAAGSYDDLIYVGDGPTDIGAFAHVIRRGGTAVLVCAPGDDEVARQLRERGLREVHVFGADYTQDSPLRRFLREEALTSSEQGAGAAPRRR
jgi:phosphoserine phosphatase